MRRALVFVCLVGCSSTGSNPDAANSGSNERDAAPDSSAQDASTVVDAAPRAVHGVGSTYFVTDTGTIKQPLSLSTYQFTSITPDGTSFEHLPGSGSNDGTFVVPVNPNASTWDLGFAAPGAPFLFLVGNTTTPDISTYALGRPDAVMGTSSVTIDATGLAPWGTSDDLEILSSNAGALVISPQTYFAPTLAAGATSISSQTFPWSTALVDATKGDAAILFQLSTKVSGVDPYAALTTAGTATGFTQTNGQPSTLTAALAAVPQETVTVHWKRSQFEALLAQVGPAAVDAAGDVLFVIDALPGASAHGYYASAPDLVELPIPAGTTDLDETFVYGNPFATGGTPWDEYVLVKYLFTVPLLAPGATKTLGFTSGYYAEIPVTSLATDGTIAPAITGAQHVQINGRDALTAQTGVGLTPTVTWDPPATGTVSSYAVEMFQVKPLSGGTTIAEVATYFTHGTSLAIPDAVLGVDSSYCLKVLSIAGLDGTTTPFLSGPFAYFELVTAQFEP